MSGDYENEDDRLYMFRNAGLIAGLDPATFFFAPASLKLRRASKNRARMTMTSLSANLR